MRDPRLPPAGRRDVTEPEADRPFTYASDVAVELNVPTATIAKLIDSGVVDGWWAGRRRKPMIYQDEVGRLRGLLNRDVHAAGPSEPTQRIPR